MGGDVKEVIREVSSFFRFDLRRKGFVIEARPSETEWEVEAELLDPRPDLSTSYKKVYDQNIYLIRVGSDLKILSCEKIGTRETSGEIRFFSRESRVRKLVPPKTPPRTQEPAREKRFSLDPSLVRNLAEEISRRISSSPREKQGPSLEEEPPRVKGAFIDPHQDVNLDFNFTRVGKLEQQAEGNLSKAVKRLKGMSSKAKARERKGSL